METQQLELQSLSEVDSEQLNDAIPRANTQEYQQQQLNEAVIEAKSKVSMSKVLKSVDQLHYGSNTLKRHRLKSKKQSLPSSINVDYKQSLYQDTKGKADSAAGFKVHMLIQGDRKSQSLNDLQKAQQFTTRTFITPVKRNLNDNQRKQSSQAVPAPRSQTKVEAAQIIQRYYRLYRMRKHFDKIVQNVTLKTEQPSRRSAAPSLSSEQQPTIESLTSIDKPRKVSLESLYSYISKLMSSHSQEALEQEQELKRKQKLLRKCINLFNNEGTKGIKYMLAQNLLQNDPALIAIFLSMEQRLSKTQIGEFLGSEVSREVLSNFVNNLDFTGLTFDKALRSLLRTFRLPGEAQKIDRIMNEFASRYCVNNPTVFSSSDTAYVLAYSLIMLNTDAHNPNVKKKMELQDFIKNNRGIDNEQDLPTEFLQQLYNSIVRNQIKMNEHDNMFQLLDLSSRIEGKFDQIAEPHRVLIGEYYAHHVPDVFKPTSHKHERSLFLFNDLLIVTKPKVTFYGTSHSEINMQLKAESARAGSVSNGSLVLKPQQIAPKMSLPQPITRPMSAQYKDGKYVHRHTFNFVSMTVEERVVLPHYPKLLEISNNNGRLIYLNFLTDDERFNFVQTLRDYSGDVQDYEDEKRVKVSQLTQSKSQTARARLEQLYNQTQTQRYASFGTLREARQVLLQQASLLRGINPKKQLHPDVLQIKDQLMEFSVFVDLQLPSPSPEIQVQQSIEEQQVEVETNVVHDEIVLPSQEDNTLKRRNSLSDLQK